MMFQNNVAVWGPMDELFALQGAAESPPRLEHLENYDDSKDISYAGHCWIGQDPLPIERGVDPDGRAGPSARKPRP